MFWGKSNSKRVTVNESQYNDPNMTLMGKLFSSAEHLSGIAYALLYARGKVRPIDMLAIGMQATKAGLGLYRTWDKRKPVNLSKYFADPRDTWELAPYFVSQTAFTGIEIPAVVVEPHKTTRGGLVDCAVWTATVDGVEIGWVGPPTQDDVPDLIYSRTPEKIRAIAARRMWEKAGSDKILRIQGEKTFPQFLPHDVIETKFLTMMEERVRKFLDKGLAWSIVMDGQPGTGKSVAVGYIAKKLGFRTVVVGAEDFCSKYQDRDGVHARGVQLAEILQPDVLIVNDVDRLSADDQLRLLEIFDNAKSFAKLIFATTNHYRKLLEPVRRPGRLDDLIHVPGLSLEEVQRLAPSLVDHAERMVDWPIAYVRNMQDRYSVLGDMALAEFVGVERRLEEIRKDGGYESTKTEDDRSKNEHKPNEGVLDFMEQMSPGCLSPQLRGVTPEDLREKYLTHHLVRNEKGQMEFVRKSDVDPDPMGSLPI